MHSRRGEPQHNGSTNTALHVVSVPCEREPDLPRVLWSHRIWARRAATTGAEHGTAHGQLLSGREPDLPCVIATRSPLCVPWPPPDARPPLQSQTLCALMPPLIRKRGRASAIYLVSGGTSWNDRLIFFGWDARHLELISPGVAILSQPHRVVINV